MSRWLFTEVNYTPQSKSWREKTGGLTGTVRDMEFWLSEICEIVGNQGGWELVTVLWEERLLTWHMLFKKPGSV